MVIASSKRVYDEIEKVVKDRTVRVRVCKQCGEEIDRT